MSDTGARFLFKPFENERITAPNPCQLFIIFPNNKQL